MAGDEYSPAITLDASTAVAATWRSDPAVRLLLLLAFLTTITAGIVAATLPLDDKFDELAHYSYVRAMAERPTLLPDHDAMRLLDETGIGWSDRQNYLAHPPLYHLLAAPLAASTPGDPRLLRFVDVALVVVGLLLAGFGGLARLRDPHARLVFAATLFGLPATIGVAGLVNNDDLMIAEIGALFFLLTRDRAPPWAVGLLLALLGWTKFTGFVAAATAIALLRSADIAAGRTRPFGAETLLPAAGLLVGLVPTLVTLATHGRPVWIPSAFPDWFEVMAPAERASIGLLDFARLYLDHLGRRLPYRADDFDAGAILIALFVAAALSLRRVPADRPARRLARVGLATSVFFVVLHFAHAWFSLRNQGILADLQTRYLGAIWPFFAFCVALGLAGLPPRPRRLAIGAHFAGLVAISVFGAAFFRIAARL
jgi:hypothetical protein